MTDNQTKLRLLKMAREHLWNGMERRIMGYGPQPATLCGAMNIAECMLDINMPRIGQSQVYKCGRELRWVFMTPHENVRRYLLKTWGKLPKDLRAALNPRGKPANIHDMNGMAVQQYRMAWLNQLIKDYEQLVRKDAGGEGTLEA
jgi:hypothetical protein